MMKQYFGLTCCLLFAPPAFAQTPGEKTEKRLGELLTPGGHLEGAAFSTKPVTWKAPKALDNIALPVRPYTGVLVRLPRSSGKEVKPRSAPEGIPLASFQDGTQIPAAVLLPDEALIRLPSLDVHAPLPIPILAQPQKDRVSLGDPALAASLDAALKSFTPVRDKPVPFTPLNLPDPFEHIRTGQLRNPPEENPTPPAIPLTKPTK
jgi:hypothetical protein